MSDKCQREMSLREWVERLPEIHRARKEYVALIDKVNKNVQSNTGMQANAKICQLVVDDTMAMLVRNELLDTARLDTARIDSARNCLFNIVASKLEDLLESGIE